MRPPHFAHFGPDALRLTSNHPTWNGPLAEIRDTFGFRPHFGWVGAIEHRR